MTDKIIINSVDVSECLYRELRNAAYDKRYNHCKRFPNGCCSKNNNCYYKQLKRKTKECEGLRHGQHLQNKVIKDLQEQLQAEKEKVRELKNECNKYKKQYRRNRLDRKKYKQALEEIKKMIQQEICTEECLYDWEKNCPDSDCRYNQILQKCEVLNDV